MISLANNSTRSALGTKCKEGKYEELQCSFFLLKGPVGVLVVRITMPELKAFTKVLAANSALIMITKGVISYRFHRISRSLLLCKRAEKVILDEVCNDALNRTCELVSKEAKCTNSSTRDGLETETHSLDRRTGSDMKTD